MKLKIIICLDDNNGMLFNNRRQSRDRLLTADIIENLKDEKLNVFDFSSQVFAEYSEKINICTELTKGKTHFVENVDLKPFEDSISEIIVYRWNRSYPADFTCDVDFGKFTLVSETEFAGNSHEKITKLIYIKAGVLNG